MASRAWSISLPLATAATSSVSTLQPTCARTAGMSTASTTLSASSTTRRSRAGSSSCAFVASGGFSSWAAFSDSWRSGRCFGCSASSFSSSAACSSFVAHLRKPSRCLTCASRTASASFSALVRVSSGLASSGFFSSALGAVTAYCTVKPPRVNLPAGLHAGSPKEARPSSMSPGFTASGSFSSTATARKTGVRAPPRTFCVPNSSLPATAPLKLECAFTATAFASGRSRASGMPFRRSSSETLSCRICTLATCSPFCSFSAFGQASVEPINRLALL
mmetsp:Transcript_2407/g.6199  ORF Transcript_2407/g.6199 Transcript_2407/m.6199 type:complete len:277 (-) Transcript_2407:852-1682(-)